MLRIITVLVLLFNLAWGNNIQIENVRLADQNTTDDYYFVEFDLSWENSWRTSTFERNYDAAWVFVKFTPKNQQEWTHASLHYVNGTNDGHLAPSGATINTTSMTRIRFASSDGQPTISIFLNRLIFKTFLLIRKTTQEKRTPTARNSKKLIMPE